MHKMNMKERTHTRKQLFMAENGYKNTRGKGIEATQKIKLNMHTTVLTRIAAN